LWFSETSLNNVLDYVVLRYASYGLLIETSSLTLTNSIVEESANDGINIGSELPLISGPTITGNAIRNNNKHGILVYSTNATITNNTISGNGFSGEGYEGIWAGGSSTATITGNTITGNSTFGIILGANALNSVISGNVLFLNGSNGIGLSGVDGEREISVETTWGSLDAPYVVAKGQLTVTSGVTVTISPGVVVKFDQQGLVVHGTLIADGTPEQPSVFTTINDDSFGGDTNGDGSATLPVPGNWYYIWFTSSSVSIQNVLDHVIIRYGGMAYNGSIILDTSC
jgi:parallel beta-helix repeat protein